MSVPYFKVTSGWFAPYKVGQPIAAHGVPFLLTLPERLRVATLGTQDVGANCKSEAMNFKGVTLWSTNIAMENHHF